MPELHRHARQLLKCPPIYLKLAQAERLLAQFLETAEHRGWVVHAIAIMANHYHVVIEAEERWKGDRILADLKAYGTRRLSGEFGAPASRTWWTGKGSTRKLATGRAVEDTINYVLYKQPNPLVVWSRTLGRLV